MADNKATTRDVFIVDGARTPFLKARGKPGPFAAADLAVYAGRDLLARQPFAAMDIDEVIFGCIIPSEDEANIARIIGLRLGCGNDTPAWTVQRNCASGMQSIDSGAKDIALGRADLVLAGGTEAMSRAPLLYNHKAVNWFANMFGAKTAGQKAKVFSQLRPSFFSPVIALLHGLTDPVIDMIMGKTAENLAYRFNLTREQIDEFSVQSHQRVAQAIDNGYFGEVVPVYDNKGHVHEFDDGLRRDSSVEKLAKLRPNFDHKFGMVTPGNSSQITDGAAALILASEDAVKKHNLPVLGRIVDMHWAALEPEEMGLGPVFASTPLLQKRNLKLDDIDYWEINEAFSAQVLGCLAAWESDEYCRTRLGLDKALGKIDQDRLNVDGGGIAMGHPVGASGARIVLHLLEVLKRKKAKRGIATICIGGGQGGAMLVERV